MIDEIEKTLCTVDLAIAKLYAGLVEDGDLANEVSKMVEAEYDLTVKMLARVTGERILAERFARYRARLADDCRYLMRLTGSRLSCCDVIARRPMIWFGKRWCFPLTVSHPVLEPLAESKQKHK